LTYCIEVPLGEEYAPTREFEQPRLIYAVQVPIEASVAKHDHTARPREADKTGPPRAPEVKHQFEDLKNDTGYQKE